MADFALPIRVSAAVRQRMARPPSFYLSSPWSERDSLLQLDHLGYNILDRGRPIEPVGVPEVNGLNPESFQALFTGNWHVCGVTAEPKTPWQLYGAELGSEEDIFALLRVQGQPLSDNVLSIALPGMPKISKCI